MVGKPKKRALGRGLSALLEDNSAAAVVSAGSDLAPGGKHAPNIEGVQAMPVELILPRAEQPRKHFDDKDLDELSISIKGRGILQPIVVRANPEDQDTYEIIAGERRWRAAQRAQLHEVPVIVRNYTDAEALEIAIIENVQRADLNSIEEANGYAQLIEAYGYTQEDMAQLIGKSRPHIANVMRLLKLPQTVRILIEEGAITAGHGRALIGHDDAEELAKLIARKGLTVREAEKLAAESKKGARPKPAPTAAGAVDKDADTLALEGDLSAALGAPVTIEHKGKGGKLSIRYDSLDQLDDLCEKLGLGF